MAIQNGTPVVYVGPNMQSIGFPNDLVLPAHSKSVDVVDKIEGFLALSVEQQFEIASAQFAALQTIRSQIEFRRVWMNLGRTISETLQAQWP
jgi:hypothetical protein